VKAFLFIKQSLFKSNTKQHC